MTSRQKQLIAARPESPSRRPPAPVQTLCGLGGSVAETLSEAREAEQRYRGLLELASDAVLVVVDGRIVFANPKTSELLGRTPEAILGRFFLEFLRPKERPAVVARLAALVTLGQTAPFVDRSLRRADGAWVGVEVALQACRFRSQAAIQVVIREVGEQRRLQAQAIRWAQYDPLTRLANRSQYLDRLEGAVARAARTQRGLCVLCLGLDHFQAVNDELGQRGGDAVLSQVAERLKRVVRKSDTLARLGGDEFSVILEGLTDAQGASIAADRLRATLATAFVFETTPVLLSASLGLCMYPNDATDRDALLRKALMAMNHVKRNGRNAHGFYSAAMEAQDQAGLRQRHDIQQRMDRLTPRERDVLDLLVAGQASKMIAHLLGISVRTIDIHRGRVMEKMQARSAAALVHMRHEIQP